MAEDINAVINKLKADNLYPGMFKAAFGNSEINSQLMLKAMAQFSHNERQFTYCTQQVILKKSPTRMPGNFYE
jgi:cytochrome c peroxidase